MPAFRERAYKALRALIRETTDIEPTNIYIEKVVIVTNFTNLGQIANLNSQGYQVAETINANVGQLQQNSGTKEIAEAIRNFTEAIGAETTLSDLKRKYLLDQISLLGAQAAAPAAEREPSLIKPIIDTMSGVCAGIGGLAAAWATWGIVISKFFGF